MKSLWFLLLFCFSGLSLCAQSDFVASEFTPGTFAKFSLGLLYDQATAQVPVWGSGMSGLEKRAEWRTAGLLSRAATEYTVNRMMETDTRYARCRCKGFLPRSRHVLTTEFLSAPVARFSGLATSTVVTSIGGHSGAGSAAGHAVLLVNTDIGFNMLNEFWPEIRRTMLLRRK